MDYLIVQTLHCCGPRNSAYYLGYFKPCCDVYDNGLFTWVVGGASGQPVTSSTATSTDTSSAAGSRAAPSAGATPAAFPPGDFLQNIIQMAANSGLRAQQGPPQPGLLC